MLKVAFSFPINTFHKKQFMELAYIYYDNWFNNDQIAGNYYKSFNTNPLNIIFISI